MQVFQPTAAEIAARVNEFTTEAEAIKDWRCDKSQELKAKFDKITAGLVRHSGMEDSACNNAADTMKENGLSQWGDKSGDCEFWGVALSTLECFIDSPESYGFNAKGEYVG
jgi:hypothetical protein